MKKHNAAPQEVEHNGDAVTMAVVVNNDTTEQPKKPVFLTLVKSVKEETQLLNQWEKLDQTEKELDSFTFGGDTIRDTLTIKDSEGHAFSTNNTFLISQVTDLLKDLVSRKKEEIAAELTSRRAA